MDTSTFPSAARSATRPLIGVWRLLSACLSGNREQKPTEYSETLRGRDRARLRSLMRLHIHYSRVSGSEPVIQAFRKFLEETDINNEARFKEIDETPELKLDKIRQRHQLLPGAPAIVYIENTESKGNEGPRHIAIFYDSTPKSEPPKTEIEKLLVVVFRNTGDEPIIGSSTINKWSTIMPDDIRHANRGDFVKNLVAATAEGKSSL